jgi:hypothetical protein
MRLRIAAAAAVFVGLVLVAVSWPGRQKAADRPPVPPAAKPEADVLDVPPKQDKIATALRGEVIYDHAARAVAISPDGRQVAVGNGAGTIQLWSLPDNKLQRTINAHKNWAFDLAYAPDGTLVSGGGDNRIKLFDAASGDLVRSFDQHTNDLHGVAITPNGQWLISGGDDAVVFARSLTDETLKTLGRHLAQVTAVAVSPDGRWAASAGRDHQIQLWDLETFTVKNTLMGHTADVMSVAFSPDSTHVVSGGYDNTIRIWQITHPKPNTTVSVIKDLPDWAFSVLFDRSGQYVIYGGGKGWLGVSDLKGKWISSRQLDGDVSDLALSTDGRTLAAVTSKGGLHLFEIDPTTAVVGKETVLAPPKPNPESTTAPVLTPAEYVKLHEAILRPSPQWGDAVAAVAPFGDPFTASVLRDTKDDDLPPDQREIKTRVLQQIATRRGEFKERLKPEEVAPMLQRAAVADLTCSLVEGRLPKWVTAQLTRQLSEPGVREQLEKLRSSPPVESETEKQPWGLSSERVRSYLDGILGPIQKK